MANNRGDIDIDVTLGGLTGVIRGLSRLRQSGRAAVGSMSDDFGKLRESLSGVAGGIGKIGLAAGGIGVASFAGLTAALTSARGLAQEVTEEITQLQKLSDGFNMDGAGEVRGLTSAGQTAGIEDAATFVGVLSAVSDAIIGMKGELEEYDKARAGGASSAPAAAGESSKSRFPSLSTVGEGKSTDSAQPAQAEEIAEATSGAMMDAFHELGLRREDLFSADGTTKSMLEILKSLSAAVTANGNMDQVVELLQPILGSTDAMEMKRFLGLGPEEIQRLVDQSMSLTAISAKDEALAKELKKSSVMFEDAMMGLRNAFTAGISADLAQSQTDFALFSVQLQEQAEEIGAAMGGIFVRVMPVIQRVMSDALLLMAGQSEQVAEGPIKTALEGLFKLIDMISTGLLDFLDYLATGETDVQWIKTVGELFSQAAKIVDTTFNTLTVITDFISDWVVPAMSGLYELFGVDEPEKQLAITLALITFSGAITTAVGLLGKLAKGAGIVVKTIGTVGSLAAGAGAVIGGVAYSTLSLRDSALAAAERAKELAETEGEAFAAAYYKTWLETVPEQHRGAMAFNKIYEANDWLFSGLTGKKTAVDFEGAKKDTQAIIDAGSQEDALRGTELAIEEMGIKRNAENIHELEVSLRLKGLTADPGMMEQLNALREIESKINLSGDGVAAKQEPTTVMNVTLPSGGVASMTTTKSDGEAFARQIQRENRADLG